MRLQGKTKTLAGLGLMVSIMVGLTAYSPTLYEIFCEVTGYGGTTQRADANADKILDRKMVIRFNADVNSALDWKFVPAQKAVTVNVGQTALAFYRAKSNDSAPVTGTATFNVTPAKAGQYFAKIDCFCFTEQTLAAGEEVDMPVQFYIDPAIAEDRNLDEVETITLSYTFFPIPDQKGAAKKQAVLDSGKGGAMTRQTVN